MSRGIKVLVPLAVLVASFVVHAETSAQRTRLMAHLKPVGWERLAGGKAKFEQRFDRTRFSAEVEDLAVTTAIEVYVNGALVGAQVVDETGTADLNLDSRDRDWVPEMVVGDIVEVLDQDGNLILEGVMRRRS